MTQATCETCRFWAGRKQPAGSTFTQYGICHRFPPPRTRTAAESLMRPETIAGDWCGEHQAKAESEDAKHAAMAESMRREGVSDYAAALNAGHLWSGVSVKNPSAWRNHIQSLKDAGLCGDHYTDEPVVVLRPGVRFHTAAPDPLATATFDTSSM